MNDTRREVPLSPSSSIPSVDTSSTIQILPGRTDKVDNAPKHGGTVDSSPRETLPSPLGQAEAMGGTTVKRNP